MLKSIFKIGIRGDLVLHGGVAQLGEHLLCKQGVRSSILLISTRRARKTSERLKTLRTEGA